MTGFSRKLLLGSLGLGLIPAVVPMVSAGATPTLGSCLVPPHLTGWYQSCSLDLTAGTSYLKLTLTSGSGFAAVACKDGSNAALVDPAPPGGETRFDHGTTSCQLVAGGDGSPAGMATVSNTP